jgi:hypothetical protein
MDEPTATRNRDDSNDAPAARGTRRSPMASSACLPHMPTLKTGNQNLVAAEQTPEKTDRPKEDPSSDSFSQPESLLACGDLGRPTHGTSNGWFRGAGAQLFWRRGLRGWLRRFQGCDHEIDQTLGSGSARGIFVVSRLDQQGPLLLRIRSRGGKPSTAPIRTPFQRLPRPACALQERRKGCLERSAGPPYHAGCLAL